ADCPRKSSYRICHQLRWCGSWVQRQRFSSELVEISKHSLHNSLSRGIASGWMASNRSKLNAEEHEHDGQKEQQHHEGQEKHASRVGEIHRPAPTITFWNPQLRVVAIVVDDAPQPVAVIIAVHGGRGAIIRRAPAVLRTPTWHKQED